MMMHSMDGMGWMMAGAGLVWLLIMSCWSW